MSNRNPGGAGGNGPGNRQGVHNVLNYTAKPFLNQQGNPGSGLPDTSIEGGGDGGLPPNPNSGIDTSGITGTIPIDTGLGTGLGSDASGGSDAGTTSTADSGSQGDSGTGDQGVADGDGGDGSDGGEGDGGTDDGRPENPPYGTPTSPTETDSGPTDPSPPDPVPPDASTTDPETTSAAAVAAELAAAAQAGADPVDGPGVDGQSGAGTSCADLVLSLLGTNVGESEGSSLPDVSGMMGSFSGADVGGTDTPWDISDLGSDIIDLINQADLAAAHQAGFGLGGFNNDLAGPLPNPWLFPGVFNPYGSGGSPPDSGVPPPK